MMGFPSRREVEMYKKMFPDGCRVRLNYMDDMHAPPVGTFGTVARVDDIGTVHVRWDNGQFLGCVIGEDSISRVIEVEDDLKKSETGGC